MDKSSSLDITIEEQRSAWNIWNAKEREASQGIHSRRQAELVEAWMPECRTILEVGCGTGWMANRLSTYGKVTAIDLADEVIARARERYPQVVFQSGDFLSIDFPQFDAAVALEVLSHVMDHQRFLSKIASVLKPDGILILATQNRPVLERDSSIKGPIPGQLRHWVSAQELRSLLYPSFRIERITSVVPAGNQGRYRLINGTKLNKFLSCVFGEKGVEAFKERRLWGHTLLVLASKKP